MDQLACPVEELAEGESLRDRLRGGELLGLLPLFEFLRTLTDYHRWSPAPLRATFLIDDPNLHWRAYGYVRFPELAEAASVHGYHVTFATVPVDCWFALPSAVRLFRTSDRLSLTAHGVYHLYEELAVPRDPAAAVDWLAAGVARLERFQSRFGLPVDRVMVPPHGASSLAVHAALIATGFEAICRAPRWWSDWPAAEQSAAGIDVASVSPIGLPVIGRIGISDATRAREEATICAYLDQPVVWYGHHSDLADGYDVLADLAAWLHSFGDPHWLPLGEIARTNYLLRIDRRAGNGHVRLFSRRCELVVPEGVERIFVEAPASLRATPEPIAVGELDSVTITAKGVTAQQVVQRRPKRAPARAVARRAAVEARDRMQPLASKLKVEPLLRAMERLHRKGRSLAASRS
jgi:hypothetical protein